MEFPNETVRGKDFGQPARHDTAELDLIEVGRWPMVRIYIETLAYVFQDSVLPALVSAWGAER